ncbi:hypothetical protein ACHAO7_011155 [Fusarium culmorum]
MKIVAVNIGLQSERTELMIWEHNIVDYIMYQMKLSGVRGGASSKKYQNPFPRGFDTTKLALDIDQLPYKGGGSYKDTFDYLMPRVGNIWRMAMDDYPAEEKSLVEAFSQTCKANDDYMYMSEDQDRQGQNSVRRFPSEARDFVKERGLMGRERGAYSKVANRPFRPKGLAQ